MITSTALQLLHEAERQDPRTISEMIAADEYQDVVVEKAEWSPDSDITYVTVDDGWSVGVTGPPRPEPGDTIRFYEAGGLGSSHHGWALNGDLVYWRTPLERHVERLKWLAANDREQRERFERTKADLDRQFAALSPALQRRIERFRAEDPAFRVQSEAYEMYACVDADVIAEHLRPQVEAGQDPMEAVKAFHDLPWETQKAIGIQDGHSGNTFGGACKLAYALLAGREA